MAHSQPVDAGDRCGDVSLRHDQPGARIAVRAGLSRKRIGEIFLLAYPYGGAYACHASFSAARQTFAEIAQEQKTAAKAKCVA